MDLKHDLTNSLTNSAVVVYHARGNSPCMDGFCGAWIMNMYLRHNNIDDVLFFHGDHNNSNLPSIQQFRDKDVFLIDFVYPIDFMVRINKVANNFIVFDHHKSSEHICSSVIKDHVIFDRNRSGAKLVWDWLASKDPDRIFTDDINKIVEYIQDRDLWRWALPCSREINAAVYSYDSDFEAWDDLFGNFESYGSKTFEELKTEGESIVRSQEKVISSAVNNAFSCVIDGYNVYAVNATFLYSEIANRISTVYSVPFGVAFEIKNKMCIYHLRTNNNYLDLSEIAKKFGGGGHRRAASFKKELEEMF